MSGDAYRSVFSRLFDDPDYQKLSQRARHLLLTARQCRSAGPAAIFRYYPETLAHQTGLTIPGEGGPRGTRGRRVAHLRRGRAVGKERLALRSVHDAGEREAPEGHLEWARQATEVACRPKVLRLLQNRIPIGMGTDTHDGPLSVRRAYSAAELRALAEKAGMHAVRVERHPWFGRLMTVIAL